MAGPRRDFVSVSIWLYKLYVQNRVIKYLPIKAKVNKIPTSKIKSQIPHLKYRISKTLSERGSGNWCLVWECTRIWPIILFISSHFVRGWFKLTSFGNLCSSQEFFSVLRNDLCVVCLRPRVRASPLEKGLAFCTKRKHTIYNMHLSVPFLSWPWFPSPPSPLRILAMFSFRVAGPRQDFCLFFRWLYNIICSKQGD